MTDTTKKQEEQKNPFVFRPEKKPTPRRERLADAAHRMAEESKQGINLLEPAWRRRAGQQE